ncbi:MAG: hypothetical protein KJ712_11550 [Bacteroidetes bacterium]|nr:hypothetical protein [Bacteroidota bacterium]MBU1484509.1 hypothetical protein [Bacteroidota bacterium]MBU2047351.1 hypothetical protein [Bacteroidota bacterium]MBU2267812.1 hypothetical protein [Bacteroidota bacterium]MBU2375341.1 hypothetical protein [Bacteroidota bacterium]
MTFQNRKTTGKFWDKTKEKREELHERDAVKANHPKVIEKEKPTEEKEIKKEK